MTEVLYDKNSTCSEISLSFYKPVKGHRKAEHLHQTLQVLLAFLSLSTGHNCRKYSIYTFIFLKIISQYCGYGHPP